MKMLASLGALTVLATLIAGCAAPIARLSQQTLDARVAAHAAALAQALETKREIDGWYRAFGVVQSPLPVPVTSTAQAK
jgi:hypothetical protein